VDLLNELGVHAKNHMSAIDENAANYVIRKYGTELQKKEINLMSEKEPIGLEKESDKVQTEAKKMGSKNTVSSNNSSNIKKSSENKQDNIKDSEQKNMNVNNSMNSKQHTHNTTNMSSQPNRHMDSNKNAAVKSQQGTSDAQQGTATYRQPRPQGGKPPYQGGNQQGTNNAQQGTATYRQPRPQGGKPPYQGGNQQGANNAQQGTATYRQPRPQGGKPSYQGSNQQGQYNNRTQHTGQLQNGKTSQGQGAYQSRPQGGPKPSYQGGNQQNQHSNKTQYSGQSRPSSNRNSSFGLIMPPPPVIEQVQPKGKQWGQSKSKRRGGDEEDYNTRSGAYERRAEKRGRKKPPTSAPLEDSRLLTKRITSTADDVYEDELIRTSTRKREKPTKVKKIEIEENITVRDLAVKLEISGSDAVRKLVQMGVMASINQELESDVAQLLASEYGVETELASTREERELTVADEEDNPADMITRPPVVTIMGHVDHGKTSLLDTIRKANVTATEAGGITQHIGAYQVELDGRKITFLDTPGHEAFTSMRARGAQATDVAVLVVAADDGVMPQTKEAINHARAANVPIVVAINKIDRPEAQPDRVKRELMEVGLVSEEWGGDAVMVEVSAKKQIGINDLLEMILLVADMRELKANPSRRALGVVIEAKVDKGRGPVATVLIQKGTLHVGDIFLAGETFGRVRAMVNYKGATINEAPPSTPVEVLGLNDVPDAGDIFQVVSDEREARQVAEKRADHRKNQLAQQTKKVSLDDLFKQIQEGNVKDLNIVVKADVQGSAEAVKQSLEKLSTSEVRVNVIHCGVGTVTESDIMLASASNAIIIGFNVRPDAKALKSAEAEDVDVRLYRIIYEAIEDVKKAMVGLLDPEFKEVTYGRAEVRNTFRVPKAGVVAGSYVTDGKIPRNAQIRVVRDGVIVHEGKILSLRRFKDDVKEVLTGFECGIGIDGWNDVKENDVIEAFGKEQIERTL